MRIITIYNYEPYYGFYLSSEQYRQQHGSGLPAHSTDIAPSLLICAEGYIPVFKGNKWVIEKDEFWRPEYKYVTYNSMFPSGSYEPIQLSLISGDFPTYPDLPQICNSNLVCILVCQKVRAAQAKYQEACDYYHSIVNANERVFIPVDGPKESVSKFCTTPSAIYQYHFLVEEMVMYMRSAIDNLVQLTYVLTNFDEYIEKMQVRQDKIGKLGTTEEATTELEKIFIGDNGIYESDPSPVRFLWVINQLSNSMKHSMMHAEVYNQLGNGRPTIVSYYADFNDHNRAIMNHQHDLEQMMLGFQGTVLRILKNQKTYVAQI
ncbi:hypothetical protein ACPDXS_002144 [Vibrio cholerae]|uniref:hypothetical protein n=1 Tax=Vibrio cholerae TaxID=666 RepID=UPI000D33466C|nr:hypothetical protein [Vibrio cholerae]EGR1837088.1 hypothetical protein [Vibrio cholerae]EGR4363164.1 hypothetical protein [Vibrio cholerae]EJL6539211.1 hypothetical protein [Vibrio cholerae]MCD6678859.1 hypothetical protein [Vibrio cholerae]TQP21732.1 hypothetical protein FLM04_11120 [Vibrio cholerae]